MPSEVEAANGSAAAEIMSAPSTANAPDASKDASTHIKTAISDEVMIDFQHVTKTYRLYRNDKDRALDVLGFHRESAMIGEVNANDDLSFQIKRGEGVAFLGSNGAGKSTALKLVTGVSYPTSGEVTVNGRVSALLELKAGFDKFLTGRENIRLRGQIMGLSEEEIDELEPKIIKFASLGVYIDQPYRTYSSGMKSRLGFAFAASVNPDILVVDEALSVGDRKFRRKCIKRMRKIMMDENVTVLFVTHSTGTAKEFCSRGIVLDHGSKAFDGSIDEAIAIYDKMNQ